MVVVNRTLSWTQTYQDDAYLLYRIWQTEYSGATVISKVRVDNLSTMAYTVKKIRIRINGCRFKND